MESWEDLWGVHQTYSMQRDQRRPQCQRDDPEVIDESKSLLLWWGAETCLPANAKGLLSQIPSLRCLPEFKEQMQDSLVHLGKKLCSSQFGGICNVHYCWVEECVLHTFFILVRISSHWKEPLKERSYVISLFIERPGGWQLCTCLHLQICSGLLKLLYVFLASLSMLRGL